MTHSRLVEQVLALAPALRDLVPQQGCEPRYCVLSDAVAWLDEAPFDREEEFATCGITNVRLLWHHRTRLVLGQESRAAELWEVALREFPTWIGFMPERCEPTDELRALYTRVMRDGHEHWPCLRADNPSR
ncbi:MAG: hypothetical protein KF902_14930 [Phycisphaeraceae bacterium]|nr:hypothetical protein [Phycisphaeraceae bacterium]MCW5768990.1 hypothetical protein [Phycisphaeraceae bacterium]